MVDAFLKISGQSSTTFFYDSHGRPQLSDGSYISIAHKDEVLVFVISNLKVGIDIERNTPPSKQLIETYALNPFTPVKDWCMKEAYYKMTQDRQYDKVMMPKLSTPHIEIKYDPYYILVLVEDHDDVKIELFDGESIRPLPM